MNEHLILRRRVESQANLPHPDAMALRRQEWSDRFEELMHNRLILGYHRYGSVHHQLGDVGICARHAIERLQRFLKTRNLEYLVDAANFCLAEFVHAEKHGCRVRSQDDGMHLEAKRLA